MQQKVLIIEESASNINLLKKLVEMAGLKPLVATSLTAAKHIFIHSDPEDYLCAIVEYELPDAPRGEAIDFTVKSYLPTIVTTARLDENIRDAVLSRDVVDYIPKENAQIFDYLKRLLGRLEKNKTTGVLVINPKRSERSAKAALLRRHNFITYECATAAEAESLLDKHSHIKLIFVDSDLQDKPATQFIAWLRKQYSKEDLAIIGVANNRNNLLTAQFIKSGASDCIRKPYHLEEFLCRVNQNIELLENVETIRRNANTDYLTGLPNRRHFFYTVNKKQRNQPSQQALALLDLDHFKSINDTHGHDAGDEVLREVAKRLAVICSDVIIARFGGEEFCIYLPGIAPEKAVERLQAVCKKIGENPIACGELMLKVTVSIGLTTENGHNIQSMLTTADKFLYRAKHNGRNRVVHDVN